MDEARGVLQRGAVGRRKRKRRSRKRLGGLSELVTIFLSVSLFYCKMFDKLRCMDSDTNFL